MWGIFNWLKGLFSKLLREFRVVIKQLFKNAFERLQASLKDIAKEVVKELELSDLKSGERREAAFKKIKDYAVAKGIAALNSEIYFAIELALQVLKKGIA